MWQDWSTLLVAMKKKMRDMEEDLEMAEMDLANQPPTGR